MIPDTNHYWLINAHLPIPLLVGTDTVTHDTKTSEFVFVDLEIKDGLITQIVSAGLPHPDPVATVDLKRGLVWPCFVDMHTHLDKGHSWGRSPNRDGSFETALNLVTHDRQKYWDAEDLYRRMEFGLKCSYAHGTQAVRTHLDAIDDQATISLGVFKALKEQWADRITLQAVSLVPLDYFLTPEGEVLADQVAKVSGVLGGFPIMSDDLDRQLDRVFDLATERGLDLDFHTDESGNPADIVLRRVAEAAIRHNFSGQVICGHCCSLAVQSAEEVFKTMDVVKQAGIGIVSLPMCNLYLQDRQQTASQHFSQAKTAHPLAHAANLPTYTPRWRGVTLLHELKHYGIPVAVASDNCRDPFHGFGDHDGLEVFTQSTRIAHLDAPYGDWCKAVTMTPADLLKLPTAGRVGVGLPANLVVFKARYYSELLSRPQSDRIVLRNGKAIDTTLPDYAELDDLL
ncbi:cytosine deaminase [Oculatella sp. LEGE 06141]|uniref:cytosine deaminase n=1 Tax=Oculatella sp. LEGE 06141 TaxID=1828648 RepID=UPI00187E554B|nr:cytosine deaminase [Oculatella sp. LEGE 06141]